MKHPLLLTAIRVLRAAGNTNSTEVSPIYERTKISNRREATTATQGRV